MPPSEPAPADVPPTAEGTTPPATDPSPVARPVADGREYEHVYDDDDSGEFDFDPTPRRRRMARFVRVMLVGLAVVFTAVLVTAVCLNPYQADGTAKTMETHRQLGLPKCSMVEMTGKPCPACGMTTSFSLLMHADVPGSLGANWVGTLLCGALVVVTPWAAVSGWRGRLLWVRNGEMFATILLTSLLLLMVGRWGWIMIFQ